MLNCVNWFRSAMVALATLGIIVPSGPLRAAESKAVVRPSVRTTDAKVLDIALSAGGTFTGRVVDQTGAAVEGAEVTVKQGSTEIAHAITDRTGTFAVGQLKSGTYAFSSGATTGIYRVWTEKTAPPSANPQGMLILGQNGTRGQFAAVDGGGNLLIATIAVIGLGVGIATLVEVLNVKDQVNKIPQSP